MPHNKSGFPLLISSPIVGRLAGFVRLKGPLSDDPKAGALHALLLGILAWIGVHVLIILPFIGTRKPLNLAISAALALTAIISLYLLRRGSLRKAAMVYIVGWWLFCSMVIVLSGGIRSPALLFYTALPISAAWLFGYRGTLLTAGACISSVVALALMETAGLGPYWYFPGVPFGILAVVILAILIAALPVAHILRMLDATLAQSKLDQEALRRERDVMSRVMETSPAGIVAFDRDGKITFANARGASVLGATPDETRRRFNNSDEWKVTTFDGQPLPDDQRPFVQVRSRREALYGMKFAIQPGDKRILVSVNVAPLVDAAGEFDGMVASVEDVTESRRVEEELLRHQDQLREMVDQRTSELVAALDQARAADRARMLFLANMSHELRTPLNAILGFSDLLRREAGLSAKQAEALDIISRNGSELLAWIEDILDIAKLETGHGQLEITTVDLIELVSDVMKITRASAEEKGLNLLSEWSGVPVHLIRTDTLKLRQILVNLVSNAIKYTDTGSVVLHTSAARLDDAGRLGLKFEVQDTGIGIAPDDHGRIFEPFVQLSQPSSRKRSGLGLAICRRFARMMGGAIQVESAPGTGSTFRVELAVEAASEGAATSVFERHEIPVGLAPDQPQFRVLLIESDSASCRLRKRLLETVGFQTRAAEDSETGIAAFAEWRPHFIWLDIQLPGGDGWKAATLIRALPGGQEVKIAALTGARFDRQHDVVQGAGIDDFVSKPLSPKTAFACMERLLGVRYLNLNPSARPVTELKPYLLAAVAGLPEDLKSQLLEAVLLLDQERIIQVIGSVSAVNPALGSELTRHAQALEFTPIMRALRSEQPA